MFAPNRLIIPNNNNTINNLTFVQFKFYQFDFSLFMLSIIVKYFIVVLLLFEHCSNRIRIIYLFIFVINKFDD